MLTFIGIALSRGSYELTIKRENVFYRHKVFRNIAARITRSYKPIHLQV